MPSKTQKQARLMAMCAHKPENVISFRKECFEKIRAIRGTKQIQAEA